LAKRGGLSPGYRGGYFPGNNFKEKNGSKTEKSKGSEIGDVANGPGKGGGEEELFNLARIKGP